MSTEYIKQEDVYNQADRRHFFDITDNQSILSQITGAVPNVVKWGVGSAAVVGSAGAALGASMGSDQRLNNAALGGGIGAVAGGFSGVLAAKDSLWRGGPLGGEEVARVIKR
jgi:hypothetical protein